MLSAQLNYQLNVCTMLLIHGGYFCNPAESAAINSVLPIYVLSLITAQGEFYNKFRTPFGTESVLCPAQLSGLTHYKRS